MKFEIETLKFLKRPKLHWGVKFFCSDLYLMPPEMRTKAAVICAEKNKWIRFTCRWKKRKNAAANSYLHLELLDYPKKSSGYPHTAIDLQPHERFSKINLYVEKIKTGADSVDYSKGVLFSVDKRRSLLLWAEDPNILRRVCFTEDKSRIAKIDRMYEKRKL